MSTRANSGSEAQGERGFAERFSRLIAAHGVTAVPSLLIRNQARLDLTAGELVYLLHVLDRRWDSRAPFLAIDDVVKATGSAKRSVRDWKANLVAKGFLEIRARGREGGGRGADEHDLSKLFACLETLAHEHLDGQGQVKVPRRRPKLRTKRVQPHKGKAAGNRRSGAKRQNSAVLKRPVPAAETEAFKQNLLTPPTPTGAWGDNDEQDGAAVLKPDDSFQPALPRTAAVGLPALGADDPAERLLAAFYRGLDSDLASLTSKQRQSKLKLARELAGVGATPAQAEAYARETNADPRRTAPVTLRAFAEERQAWLQRRGRSEASGPRLVDRTGQLGSWSTAGPAERVAGDRLGTTAGAMARAIVGGAS